MISSRTLCFFEASSIRSHQTPAQRLLNFAHTPRQLLQFCPRLLTPRQLRLQLEHDMVKAQSIGFTARAHGDRYGRTGLGTDWGVPAILVLVLRHLPAMSA
jgi:hypothetical protein